MLTFRPCRLLNQALWPLLQVRPIIKSLCSILFPFLFETWTLSSRSIYLRDGAATDVGLVDNII